MTDSGLVALQRESDWNAAVQATAGAEATPSLEEKTGALPTKLP